MTYHEKRSVVHILSTIALTATYFPYVMNNYMTPGMNTEEILIFWSKAILVLIPVTIVVKIVIMILFSIFNAVATREELPKTDERDRLIELKASRNSQIAFGLGFVGALAAIALGNSVTIMFVFMIGAGVFSEVIDHLSQIYYYRSGV
ncbi:MAG: hypothetical protein HN542_07815 [Flavobacteriales bacterium]|jgi:uncharacterized membrane protein|nr:hypothetical protein [Flavobacteriales bacterium]MBT4704333.1 hypothetical protein [Flavobacteriales bacterium]MBT4930511.1 hypothetical protein [Flavobacteriales bacterium]MBT5131787.1 hypothetical protein [Flavobacteriales bacterium]MBT6132043.1 hypothetical protein [Flavobacteriales bacterium]